MSETLFGYIRVSGGGQTDKDGPIRQKLSLDEFTRKNGFGFVGQYSETVSGTVDGLNRPEFARMLAEVERFGVTGIVVERMDRLARDLIVSETLIREIRERGLKLYAADQGPVDQITADADPSRKLIRQIFSALAEYDKSALVFKLRAARERKKAQTGRCEGRKPYGKNKAEVRLAGLIRDMRGSGLSWREIAAALKDAGVTKRSGSTKWDPNTAREIFIRDVKSRATEVRSGDSDESSRAQAA